ncbi:MAG: hypothetical protein ACXVCP_09900 [Bdellovibrio sp.]
MKTNNQIFKIVLSVVFFFLIGCSTFNNRDEFANHINNDDCDKALLVVPENQQTYNIASVTKEAGGTIISYSLTGAAYVTQVVWDVTVGATSAVILCAPAIAVAVAEGSNAHVNGNLCIPADIKPILSPQLGKNTYKNTETLRCPDVSGLSKSIRSVAQCYSKKGGTDNFRKAVSTLESVTKSGSFYRCLPSEELSAFTKDLSEYKSKLELVKNN